MWRLKSMIYPLILSASLLASPIWAAGDAGMVKTLKGNVMIERGGQRQNASVGTPVQAADRIVTGADSSVGITLQDNTRLTAGPNSTLDLNKFAFDTTTHAGTVDASVKRGSLAVISGKIAKATPQNVRFATNTVTLGVRGTSFIIEAGGEEK